MSWLARRMTMTDEEYDNLGVDWVLQYEFSDIGNALHETVPRPAATD